MNSANVKKTEGVIGTDFKVKKAEWFDGSQADWERFIGPAGDLIASGAINLHATLDDVDETEHVSDFFASIVRDKSWSERVGTVNSIFRSITVRDGDELQMANVLRSMVRLTPMRSPYLFENVLQREGFEDIEVPNLSSVMVGAVPTVVAGRGALGFAMEEVARHWYKNDRTRLAGDIGVDTITLDSMIKGEYLPKTRAEVVKIADGLGVDPNVLDVAWFADKKAKVVMWFAQKPNESAGNLVRAMIMNWLAAARLGRKFMPIGPSDVAMDKYLEQAIFALEAGIHPRTAIPVVASIDPENETVFKNVVAYAEELALGGWPWKAAILCYMAANHAEFHYDIKALTSLVHHGNSYLLNSERTLPEFMKPAHARELKQYHLQWGLDLHRSVAAASPSIADNMGYIPSATEEVADTIDRFGETELDSSEPVQRFAGIVRSAEPYYGVKMTPSRRSIIEEFKVNCPELWDEIEKAGRYDVVGRSLSLADPHCDRSAISFMAFNMAVRALAKSEGIIDDDFGKSMSNAEYIAEGAGITFGGHEMRMYQGKLRPVFKTHLGEEFISLGKGQDFIPVSMIASLAATRVK
jgi:hypothetical protein